MIEYGLIAVGNQAEGVAAVRAYLLPAEFQEVSYESVQDENSAIRRVLRTFMETRHIPLILTVGGSGVGMKERVPEITNEVIDRTIPGLAELMRLAGIQKARLNALWRGTAGVKGKSLIVNLPAQDTDVAVQAVAPLLGIVLESIRTEVPA